MSIDTPDLKMTFHTACAAAWKKKRGPYTRMETDFAKNYAYDCWEVALWVDGRLAQANVTSLDRMAEAINSLIEKMWPLELI